MESKINILLLLAFFSAQTRLAAQSEISAKASGTGRTTGHIANITLRNNGTSIADFQLGPFFIPAQGQYQPYIVPRSTSIPLVPHKSVTIPLHGYCADIYSPPIPDGHRLPAPGTWIKTEPGQVPDYGWINTSGDGIGKGIVGDSSILVPGTVRPLRVTLDIYKRPELAGPLLIDVVKRAEMAFDSLKSAGKITTPYTNDPSREKEAVVQQVVWKYTSVLTGHVYPKEQFHGKMVEQLVATTGKPENALPPATQQQFEKGVDDFWDAFSAVGEQAKILSN